MPKNLYVRVTEEREIVITANSLEDAIAVATATFNGADIPKKTDGTSVGYVYRNPKQTSLTAVLDQ
jgi:hypothetical protein